MQANDSAERRRRAMITGGSGLLGLAMLKQLTASGWQAYSYAQVKAGELLRQINSRAGFVFSCEPNYLFQTRHAIQIGKLAEILMGVCERCNGLSGKSGLHVPQSRYVQYKADDH